MLVDRGAVVASIVCVEVMEGVTYEVTVYVTGM